MNRNIIIILSSIIICLVGTSFYFYRHNHTMQEMIADNTINTQNAEAESLQLQKKIGFLKTDLLVVQSDNDQLTLNNEDQQNEIRNLKNKYSEYKQNSIAIKAHDSALLALQKENDSAILKFQDQNNHLYSQNATLTKHNQELADENNLLRQQLQQLQYKNINNLRIEAIKGNSRTNVTKASQTQKLVMNFDIPASDVQSIDFVIVTPSGKQISSLENNNMKVCINSDHASLSHVELIYPATEFIKGIYTLWVYRDKSLVTQSQIRLR